MKLNFLKQVWNFIQSIPNTLKTIIIILLCGVCIYYGINRQLEQYIIKSEEFAQQNIEDAGQYTSKMALPINKDLQEIYEKDGEAKNVILLTYHNGKKTMHGFDYKYLDYLTEYNTDPSRQPVKKIFDELDWMYYFNELNSIQAKGLVKYDSLIQMKSVYPKLYYDAFRYLDTQSIAIYPLQGSINPIGLLVILYDKQKFYNSNYYETVVSPYIQSLSSMLDYNNIKKNLDNDKNE